MSAREQPRALFFVFYLHMSFFLCTFAAESCKDDEREPVATREQALQLGNRCTNKNPPMA